MGVDEVNTFALYKERYDPLPPTHDPADWEGAMKAAFEWGQRIPIGIIYRNDRAHFEEHVPVLNQGPLVGRPVDRAMLREIMNEFA